MTNATDTVKTILHYQFKVCSDDGNIVISQDEDMIILAPEQAKLFAESVARFGSELIAAKHIAACKAGL